MCLLCDNAIDMFNNICTLSKIDFVNYILQFYYLKFFFFFNKFIYLFIFGCIGSSLLRMGFL